MARTAVSIVTVARHHHHGQLGVGCSLELFQQLQAIAPRHLATSSSTRSGRPSPRSAPAPWPPSRPPIGAIALVGEDARHGSHGCRPRRRRSGSLRAWSHVSAPDFVGSSCERVAALDQALTGRSTTKREPRGRIASHADIAGMVGDDATHDSKAETGALVLGGVVRFEQLRAVFAA